MVKKTQWPNTVPNQRVATIHRESVKQGDFLGIKNANWMAASRDLGAHALLLYLYLAANADDYNLALSPAAVFNSIGMARSTYHDQFNKLILKGYLVKRGGNTYDFYETPYGRGSDSDIPLTVNGYDFSNNPTDGQAAPQTGQNDTAGNIEINNKFPSYRKRINITAHRENVELDEPIDEPIEEEFTDEMIEKQIWIPEETLLGETREEPVENYKPFANYDDVEYIF